MKQLKTVIPILILWLALITGVSYAVGTPEDIGYADNTPDVCNIHVEAVRFTESRGDQNAVSPAGAIGSMQVMPATASDPGFGVTPAKKNADGTYNLDDIDRLGAEYLGAMMDRYPHDFEAALIAYNAGPGNAVKWTLNGRNYDVLPDRVQTEDYVNKTYTTYFQLLAEVT